MCRSMVDIQSATAEIRGGKKIEERQKYNGPPITQGGHKQAAVGAKSGDLLILTISNLQTSEIY